MALTLYQTPSVLTPAYNKQIFTALSNQIAVPDFKYVVTVIVNGDVTNTYTENILQNPDGWLVFDAQNWVKNYIEHYFNPTDTGVVIATNKSIEVEVNISEYYTSTIQSTDTTNYSAFDACLTDSEFANYDYSDYLFNATTGLYFLGKSSTSVFPDDRITLGQDVWLHFINNQAILIDSIEITLIRSAVIIDTVAIASLPTPITAYDVNALNLNSNIFTVATPQVGDTVNIGFIDSLSATILSMSYSLQDVCTKYTDYTLYYLNRGGSILFQHFEQKSKKNFTKKTNVVTLDKNVLNTSTGAYGYTSYAREEHIVSTATESTMDLNSYWLSQSQITALKDLWDSPIVYIWDGNTLRSCRVTNSNFEEFQINNEPLISLALTIDLGVTETRQRGI
jgi:hypothetical protein